MNFYGKSNMNKKFFLKKTFDIQRRGNVLISCLLQKSFDTILEEFWNF